MLAGEKFLDILAAAGIECVSSVPCSFFAAPLQLLDDDSRFRHIPGVNEGSSLAIAAGTHIAGGRGAVIAQNSGFGNMINPLTSLVLPYRIPALVFMSMRGWPTISSGEEQHEWMGKVSADWLDSLGIGSWWLAGDESEQLKALHEALAAVDRREPAFVLVPKGAFAPLGSAARELGGETPAAGVSRKELVDALAELGGDAAMLSTTGYMSRALFAGGDRPGNFYMQGSMGHVGSLALGVALSRPERRVFVLDGDGALLMHMGAMATIGAQRPGNLVHIVFDNGSYASTGAQPLGVSVEYEQAAVAAGYVHASRAETVAGLRAVLAEAERRQGPQLVVVQGVEGSDVGSRASDAVTPADMVTRFTEYFAV